MVTFLDGGDITVAGTETMTKPGGYQFSATGGNGPYTWSVSGTGATINSTTGYVTLGDGACGSFTVTCTDCTGRSGSHVGTRVTNNGQWVGCDIGCYTAPTCQWLIADTDVYSGSLRTTTHLYYCQNGPGNTLASPCQVISYGVDCDELYTCSPYCGRDYTYVGVQDLPPPYSGWYKYTVLGLTQYRWWTC